MLNEITSIKLLYDNSNEYDSKTIKVAGWVRNIRNSKSFGFINLNDGSCFSGLQIVFEVDKVSNFDKIKKLNVSASITVEGKVILTPEAKQSLEIHATNIEICGESTPEYPLQKKHHTMEYLRTIPHLKTRTNVFSATFRMRSQIAFAIHEFFNKNGFSYIHTPILTASDCEGAGEMFTVTTLDLNDIPKNDDKKVDYAKDFFGKHMSLTVSGQLEAECLALALGSVYTFGPTFRAEESNTPRHAAEFWMIEPEISFADLQDNMDIITKMIKYVISYILENCREDLEFFNKFVDKGLIDRLEAVIVLDEFKQLTYTEAIEILQKNNENFEYKVSWGKDLQTEHEKYLTEIVFKSPVFVTDYPKEIKSFYMRLNDDNKTVAAVDLLMPGVGELVGGSQREERLDYLEKRMTELGMNLDDYSWYLDLRRYGSVVHSGFGVGFERLVMYLTGVKNIRDVLPFPRT